MKKVVLFSNLSIFILMISLSGCQAIGDIFKAGVWSGIIIVVAIIGIIIYFMSRGKSSN